MPPRNKKLAPEDDKLVKDVADQLAVDQPDVEPDNAEAENLPVADDSAGDGTVEADNPPHMVTAKIEIDGAAAMAALVNPPTAAPEVRPVDMPCRVCFPDGWPAEELGAFVNCAHGHAIRYGDQVEITRERAVELGFLEADPA